MITFIMPSANAASVPGLIGMCQSACLAVRVRTGSITTTRASSISLLSFRVSWSASPSSAGSAAPPGLLRAFVAFHEPHALGAGLSVLRRLHNPAVYAELERRGVRGDRRRHRLNQLQETLVGAVEMVCCFLTIAAALLSYLFTMRF